jgi:uncharacterized protein
LADAMLGSVARKLRILGFDTLYLKDISDDDLLNIGTSQNRIILTCDKELFRRTIKIEANGVLLQGSDDFENLVHILSKYGIYSVKFHPGNSRCAVCNGAMKSMKLKDTEGLVQSNVLKWHEAFYVCKECGKLYWEGSHITSIRSMVKSIDNRLKRKPK